jgi:hypothetical protein
MVLTAVALSQWFFLILLLIFNMSWNVTIVEWTKSIVDHSGKCYNDRYTYADVFHISLAIMLTEIGGTNERMYVCILSFYKFKSEVWY